MSHSVSITVSVDGLSVTLDVPAAVVLDLLLKYGRFPGRPTRLAFELPTRTVRGIPMPNFELPNDEILTVTVKAVNSAGAFEPIPAGDTFTATSSDPASLNAVMGTDASGNVALVVNALVQAASNVTVTVTDSSGLTAATQVFDIVADATPTALVLDLVDATHVPQAVPAT